MQGLYTLVKYLPYPERGESINVGIVLLSKDKHEIRTRFLDRFPSSRTLSYLVPDEGVIKSVTHNLQKSLEESDPSTSLDLLSELSHDLKNSIQLTDFRPCSFEESEDFLNTMYEHFVKPPLEEVQPMRHVKRKIVLVSAVNRALKQVGLEKRVKKHEEVNGSFGRHKIDFVYDNSRTNFIHALTMDLSEENEFVDRTVLWEGKLKDILKVHSKGNFALVLDLDGQKYHDRKIKVQAKLKSAGAKLYEEEEIPELVEQIK